MGYISSTYHLFTQKFLYKVGKECIRGPAITKVLNHQTNFAEASGLKFSFQKPVRSEVSTGVCCHCQTLLLSDLARTDNRLLYVCYIALWVTLTIKLYIQSAGLILMNSYALVIYTAAQWVGGYHICLMGLVCTRLPAQLHFNG